MIMTDPLFVQSCVLNYILILIYNQNRVFLLSADSKAVSRRPRKHLLTPPPPTPLNFIENASYGTFDLRNEHE
jgi:hypothetical protein